MAESHDKTDNRKATVLERLMESKGIVTTACLNANVARSQFYHWVNTDENFKAAVEAVNESCIDFVESKLLEKINGISIQGAENVVYTQPPSDTAIIFYLKCKAKARGYVERTEVSPVNPDGTAYKVTLNL